uniref:Coenzyme A transferase family protein n=1 Tax=uncultured bacterium 31i10b TaxID=1701361 RepID=A0A0M4BL51_9BACT|nr:coenzyme A transferase family protein [uncultured bacterium 31i10b]
MYEIMTADEAIRLIRDGDCICVNSFVGIENPIELHEAIYRRYQKMQSPTHLTMISSAGFGVWDDEHNAEGYIREGAVDKLICGHFGAMLSTKKLVLEDRFEAYNLPLGCISHAIRAQAGGLPGALSKVGLDIFVDPRKEGPGINRISIDDSLVRHVEVDGEEFLYYKLRQIIYVFLTIFLYLLKCPQSLILSALRAFCFCGKPHISRSIFLYFRYQAWLKSW